MTWDARILFVAATMAGVLAMPTAGQSPFTTRVVEYAPAPGQFVNDSSFSDPARALGPPHGGGTSQPNNSSIVTLGGFGGSITLAFDHTVLDGLLNPFGMDAVIFGNAHWVGGNPDRHWAECAVIEISLDVNGNALPDDPWYLIPGSHLAPLPPALSTVTWDDDVDDSTYPPADSLWLPDGSSGIWTSSTYPLPSALFGATVIVNPLSGTGEEAVFGYAEYAPTLLLGDLNADNVVDDPSITPDEFYTVPDDPLTSGMSPGAGGGDAFDIAWAIDPVTGEAVHLPGFDFIRLSTAVNAVSPALGEKSAEIDAVADVSPDPFGDPDEDEDIDLSDAAWLQLCFGISALPDSLCGFLDYDGDQKIDGRDGDALTKKLTGPR